MGVPYTIVVASQKGGVGKTTVAVNLAVSLSGLGYKVLILDLAYQDPCVGLTLGLSDRNKGICSVISGKATIQDVVMRHRKTKLLVVPCELESNVSTASVQDMTRVYRQLAALDCDFIVVDTEPAIYLDLFTTYFRAFKRAEALIVLTPDFSACTSAIRLAEHVRAAKFRHLFVVNRVRGGKYELDIEEIEDALDEKMVATLSEDERMLASANALVPMCMRYPKTAFSKEMRKLSQYYASCLKERSAKK